MVVSLTLKGLVQPTQLDSGMLINVGEILYVPGLKKNVISVTVLEDKGFSVTFLEGKALI